MNETTTVEKQPSIFTISVEYKVGDPLVFKTIFDVAKEKRKQIIRLINAKLNA